MYFKELSRVHMTIPGVIRNQAAVKVREGGGIGGIFSTIFVTAQIILYKQQEHRIKKNHS